MRRLSRLLFLLSIPAAPLAAQLKSAPVYGDVGAGSGWVVGLDFGSGLNALSGQSRHFGARVGRWLGPFTLALAGGRWDAGSNPGAQVAATAALRLRGDDASALALGLLAGAGYVRSGADSGATRYLSAPLAVTLTLNRLRRRRAPVVPWVAPRVELERLSFADVHAEQGGVGASAGLSLGLVERLGVHAAMDWLWLFRRATTGITLAGGSRLTAGLGLHVLLGNGGGAR